MLTETQTLDVWIDRDGMMGFIDDFVGRQVWGGTTFHNVRCVTSDLIKELELLDLIDLLSY